MTYAEKALEVAMSSSVAVLALSNPDCTQIEMLPLKPRPMTESEQIAVRAKFIGRDLRTVGVIGLAGIEPKCAFKEPMEPEHVNTLATAFLSYLQALYAGCFLDSEAAELERLAALPDLRN